MQRTKPRSGNGLQADDEALSRVAQASPGEPTSAKATQDLATINPRTGKPLSMPKPLSLSPHEMSPIIPLIDLGPAGGEMIKETNEEVRIEYKR